MEELPLPDDEVIQMSDVTVLTGEALNHLFGVTLALDRRAGRSAARRRMET